MHDAGLKVAADRDNSDYVYSVKDLASLEGRHYHKKRNLIKQCLRTYGCQYESIILQVVPECLDMLERWCGARDCGQDPGLCSENTAIKEAFANYEELDLIGGSIRIDGRIEAFALGEELKPGTAVCHFEKAMPAFRGLAQLINKWFAEYSLKEFEFINREQDLGIAGLRQAKESYYPHHMVDKFYASSKLDDPSNLVLLNPHECGKHAPWDS